MKVVAIIPAGSPKKKAKPT